MIHKKNTKIKNSIIFVRKPWNYITFTCVYGFFDCIIALILFCPNLNTTHNYIGVLFLIASVLLKLWLVTEFLTWSLAYHNGFFKLKAWYKKKTIEKKN